MKADETALWQWLRKAEGHVALGDLHWHRVENSAEVGCPDVEGCLVGISFWVELKSVARPTLPTTPLNLRHFTTDQAMFLAARHAAGGRAFLLIQVGFGHYAARYLIRGDVAKSLLRPTSEVDLSRNTIVKLTASPLDVLMALCRA